MYLGKYSLHGQAFFGNLSIEKNLNNGQIAKHGPTIIKINDNITVLSSPVM